MIKKIFYGLLLILVAIVILYFCFPLQIGPLLSRQIKGEPVESPLQPDNLFQPSVDDKQPASVNEVYALWNKLNKDEQDNIVFVAKQIAYNNELEGLKITAISVQQKNTNEYYKYASFRLKRLAFKQPLPSEWLEGIFAEIPIWQQNAYAYEAALDPVFAEGAINGMVSDLAENKISVFEIIVWLNNLNRYPSATFKNLPLLVTLINQKLSQLKLSNAPQDQTQLYATLCVLQKIDFFKKDWEASQEAVANLKLPENIYERVQCAKYLTQGSYILKKYQQPINEKVVELLKKLNYELMMILEPDGCLPQLGQMVKRENFRETLYYATEILETNDLRFVAYGAMRNTGANQPLKNKIYIKAAKYFVSKSNWNLLDLVPETKEALEYQEALGSDASQIAFDGQSSELSFYGYCKPLLKLKLLGLKSSEVNVITDQVISISGTEYKYDEILLNNQKTKIQYIGQLNSLVLKNEDPNLVIEVKSYRSQIDLANNAKAFNTNHKIFNHVFYNFTHNEKHQGDGFVKGDFEIAETDLSEMPQAEDGYFNRIQLKNIKFLTIEAKPFLLPDMDGRPMFGDNRLHQISNIDFKNGVLSANIKSTYLAIGVKIEEKSK